MAKKAAKKKSTNKPTKAKKNPIGLLILAGIFIGFGVGFLINNIAMGFFFGMGGGFLLTAVITMLRKRS
ncbi:MAG: hypothetical protein KJ939_03260 [Nanoarchaeota archaeon]|nr:hypothetical protein [Nanoarchaeota archaeon]MBU4352077.1 hypothetical protein [Nanoarchaeota archaeon]